MRPFTLKGLLFFLYLVMHSIGTFAAIRFNDSLPPDSIARNSTLRIDLFGFLRPIHLDTRAARLSIEYERRFKTSDRLAWVIDPEYASFEAEYALSFPALGIDAARVFQNTFRLNLGLRGFLRPSTKRINFWAEPQFSIGVGYAQVMTFLPPIVEKRVVEFFPDARLRLGNTILIGKTASISTSVEVFSKHFYGLRSRKLGIVPEVNLGFRF